MSQQPTYRPREIRPMEKYCEKSKDNGQNNYHDSFVFLVTMIAKNYLTFDFNTAVQLAGGLGIPINSLQPMFVSFTNQLLYEGKIRKIPSCYPETEPVFEWI
jgi:hypothetical protein